MKKLILALFVATLSLSLAAQDSGFGIGLETGYPNTGLSLKMWTGENSAIDGSVAWNFGDNGYLGLTGDFILHNFDLISVSKGRLPLYYGIGAYLGFGNDLDLAARVPVGLAYMFEGAPVDIFLEVVPGVGVIPALNFYLSAGLGARFFF